MGYKTPAWQRKAGKSESGGLSEKGRASLRAAGHDIKRPQPEGGSRRDSFCARMKGMREKLTSSETANDPDSRINKSLRKWKCADGGPVDPYDGVQQAAKGGQVWDKPRPKKLGKPEPLSSKEKKSAKAAAKAAGRPYPNLIDNMRAARADGGELVDPYDDVQRAAHGATPAVDPVTVTEHYAPSTPQADMFRQAYNEAVPFPARALMSSAVGVHAPITEKDVTPEDRAEIIRQTQNQQMNNASMERQIRNDINMSPSEYTHRQNINVAPDMPFGDYRNYMNKALQSFERTRGKTSVSYDPSLHSINPDTGETKFSPYEEGKSGLIQSAQRAYSDPAYRVGMTLGHYNVYDTPNGRVVLDKYNFDMPNAASKNIPLSASDFSQNFMKSLRVAVPQYAPNISRPVAINLDAKPNRTYEYTGPAITTPGSTVAPDETMTPSQDAIQPPHKMIAPNFAAMMNRPQNQGNYADGGEVDDRSHEFVQEQLRSGEPQVPQYVAENDFPARAARGVEAVDTAASKVNNLLANVTGQPAMRSPEGRTASEVVQSAMPVDPYQAVQQAAMQWREGDKLGAAETMAAGMPMQGAIRAYHGSPHKFDKFDISKIGTGEGAQSYGHGLYFAENEDVARDYRNRLSGYYPGDVVVGNKQIPNWAKRDLSKAFLELGYDPQTSVHATHLIAEHGGDLDAAILRANPWNDENIPTSVYEALLNVQPAKSSGHMYEVELDVEPHQLLDWDKPLSEQSGSVKSVLNQFGLNTNPQRVWIVKETAKGGKFTVYDHWGQPQGTFADRAKAEEKARQRTLNADAHGGMYAYGQLGGNIAYSGLDKGVASNKLRGAGIPGIQYFDAGSRAAGKGSRNYVIFDPSLIDIKRRYADGGEVEGDVQFAPDDPYAKVQQAANLPMMAQNDFAMRMPQPEVRYDTGPQPGEAELKAYDPTIKERIYQGIAGTEERPSPERAQFARGMSQMAEFAPVLGNVMAGQEAQRRGDTKGMLMAALPVPGMATEARMAKSAIEAAMESRAARIAGPSWEKMTPEQRIEFMNYPDKGLGGVPISQADPQELLRQERAFEQGYSGPWYHGTARIDRLLEGKGLNPKRATSGPMPYFTDNPEIASNYAKGKEDTSLAAIDTGEIANYFTVHPKSLGWSGRTEIPVERTWHFLPNDVKQDILSKAKRIGYENPSEATGPLTLHPEGVEATLSPSHYDWVLKNEAKGNPLAALREMWHDSGELVGREHELENVFRLAGYPHPISQKNAPWTEAKGILPAMLRMERPLNTESVDEINEKVIPALEQAFKNDRSRTRAYGADQWDKNLRFTPKQWVAQLKQDMATKDNSYVWTSIPDKITKVLKELGYDGIIDTGGKSGGGEHRVAIPFGPHQVRSKFAKFDPKHLGSPDLLKSEGGEVVNNDDPYDNIRSKAKNFPRARRASN